MFDCYGSSRRYRKLAITNALSGVRGCINTDLYLKVSKIQDQFDRDFAQYCRVRKVLANDNLREQNHKIQFAYRLEDYNNFF